jgi:hypothetical protein
MRLPRIHSAIYLGASGPGWRLRRFSVTGPSVNSAPVSHVPEPAVHSDPLDRRKWGIRWILRPVWPTSSPHVRDARYCVATHARVHAQLLRGGSALETLDVSGELWCLFYFRAHVKSHVRVRSRLHSGVLVATRSRHHLRGPLLWVILIPGQGIFPHANALLSLFLKIPWLFRVHLRVHRDNRSGHAVNVETQRSLRWMERW